MDNFRAAVNTVLSEAAQGNLAALEVVLRDGAAERAARLTAANLLGIQGEPGAVCLRAALGDPATDTLGQLAAANVLVCAGAVWDESCLLAAAHSTWRRVRQLGWQQYLHSSGPFSEEFRLRWYLPRSLYREPELKSSLPYWLRDHKAQHWEKIVRAIGNARYQPAVPLLIEELNQSADAEKLLLSQQLIGFGPVAVPAIAGVLPLFTPTQRETLVYILSTIGDSTAIETLHALRKEQLTLSMKWQIDLAIQRLSQRKTT